MNEFLALAVAILTLSGFGDNSMFDGYADSMTKCAKADADFAAWLPQQYVRLEAKAWGFDPDLACKMVEYECGWNPRPGDPTKDGVYLAQGPWQFHLETWVYIREKMGRSTEDLRDDWVESTQTAMFAMTELHREAWWSSWRRIMQENAK